MILRLGERGILRKPSGRLNSTGGATSFYARRLRARQATSGAPGRFFVPAGPSDAVPNVAGGLGDLPSPARDRGAVWEPGVAGEPRETPVTSPPAPVHSSQTEAVSPRDAGFTRFSLGTSPWARGEHGATSYASIGRGRCAAARQPRGRPGQAQPRRNLTAPSSRGRWPRGPTTRRCPRGPFV